MVSLKLKRIVYGTVQFGGCLAVLSMLGCTAHKTAPPSPPKSLASQIASSVIQNKEASSALPRRGAPQLNKPPSNASLPFTVLYDDKQQGVPFVEQFLPAKLVGRTAWANDIWQALHALHLSVTPENVCAVAAIIEQESSWVADPVVPNLSKLVWEKIAEKADKYFVPLPILKALLLKPSRDGRSYKQRIDALRTERQMNDLFEEMTEEARRRGFSVTMRNPVRTGGPMQVSVAFAEAHVKIWPYPWPRQNSVRDEVFSRRGGIYFGTAILLQYPVSYSRMLFRFADFNAGRYSARNAAFQAAVAKLSGTKLKLDGDLLDYRHGQPVAGLTARVLTGLAPRLGMMPRDIERDLLLEKQKGFSETILYQRVFARVDQLAPPFARELIPTIALKSPKITRKLTTEWFAKRVNQRYEACLARK